MDHKSEKEAFDDSLEKRLENHLEGDEEKVSHSSDKILKKPIVKHYPVNPFILTKNDSLSTFALDSDTASYDIAKSYIKKGQLQHLLVLQQDHF